MTELLFREDAYLREAPAVVSALTDRGGIVLDKSIFYATSGGQEGDCGLLRVEGREIPVAITVKGEGDDIVLVPPEGTALPTPGEDVAQVLDWEPRHRKMRLHTALHLLSVVIPLPVTGGAITAAKGRLDFDMPDAPEDKDALQDALNDLIAKDYAITESWITDAELQANPGLVKTMSVMPPMGAGRVRLVRIGDADTQIDLQPCGGTHVKSTGEIGPVRLGKIEKKGKQNRRVNLFLEDQCR